MTVLVAQSVESGALHAILIRNGILKIEVEGVSMSHDIRKQLMGAREFVPNEHAEAETTGFSRVVRHLVGSTWASSYWSRGQRAGKAKTHAFAGDEEPRKQGSSIEFQSHSRGRICDCCSVVNIQRYKRGKGSKGKSSGRLVEDEFARIGRSKFGGVARANGTSVNVL